MGSAWLFNFAVLAIVFTAALSPKVQASELGFLGGVSLATSSYTFNNSPVTTGTSAVYIFGTTFHVELAEVMGVEFGAFFHPRGFSVNVGAAGFAISGLMSVNYLTLPVMFRYEVVPHLIRLGIGPYASLGITDVSVAGIATVAKSAFNWSNLDLGLIGSARVTFPIAPSMDIVGDIRYMLGLTDNETTGTAESKLRDLGFLAGISLNL